MRALKKEDFGMGKVHGNHRPTAHIAQPTDTTYFSYDVGLRCASMHIAVPIQLRFIHPKAFAWVDGGQVSKALAASIVFTIVILSG